MPYPRKTTDHHLARAKDGVQRAPRRSLAEFARELGIGEAALRSMVRRDKAAPKPVLQSGQTGYYDLAELKAWYGKKAAGQ